MIYEFVRSMDSLVVRDLKQISNHSNVISVIGGDKKMLVLQVSTVPSVLTIHRLYLLYLGYVDNTTIR